MPIAAVETIFLTFLGFFIDVSYATITLRFGNLILIINSDFLAEFVNPLILDFKRKLPVY